MNKKVVSDLFFNMLLFIISILLVVYSEKFINIITTILGVSLLLYSVYNIYNDVKLNNKNFIKITTGVIIFFIGILLIIHPSFINEFISLVIGLYILISSLGNLVNDKSSKGTLKMVYLIGIIIGILCIIGKFLIPSLILKLTGIVLLIYAIINIFTTMFLKNK